MQSYLTYCYLFPVAVVIAILAMSAGISGTNFWIPVYLIWLGIEPRTSFWLGLLTMIFGFGSGILRNLYQKTINWYIVKEYLKITVPASILGTLLVPFAPVKLLLSLFAGFILLYGAYLVQRYWFYRKGKLPEPEDHEKIYRGRAFIAGFLKGLIATGLGKLIVPGIIGHKKIRSPAEAVGSTLVVIFVVNGCALLFRLTPDFLSVLAAQKSLLFNIMIWVAPGVVLGGQIGPAVARKLSVQGMRLYVGSLLIGISLLIFLRTFVPS